MFDRVERGEVVFATNSSQGATYRVVRHVDGSYTILADGRPIEALYWRAGELDRCVRVVEQLAGFHGGSSAAAA